MIDYFTIEELPGCTMFRCERRNASLKVDSCAAIWKEANSKGSAATNPCRACPLGAEHAGEADVLMSKLKGLELCARCHRVGMRLVGGDLCVSCWNRQRELIVGKNARGVKPPKHPPVASRRIQFWTGDEVITLSRTHSVSTTELVIAALRDSSRQVFFGYGSNGGVGRNARR